MSSHSKPDTKYRASLDGLRAVCIILTLATHVKGWRINAYSNFGVDIFFGLSGWLITWLLLNARDPTIDLRKFYIRRAFRILPVYFLAIALYASAGWVLHRGPRPDLLLLTLNPEYRFGEAGLVGHAWTLGIEEKFYILWPALLALLPARQGLAWLSAGCLAVLLAYSADFDTHVIRGYFGLGAGSTLAILATRSQRVRDSLARPGLAEVAVVAILLSVTLMVAFQIGWYGNMMIGAASAALVASLWLRPTGVVTSVLSMAPLPFLGTLTYAFYLLHVLCLNMVEVAFQRLGLPVHPLLVLIPAYSLSVLVAWPTHKLVELPLIRLGRRLAGRGRARAPVVA